MSVLALRLRSHSRARGLFATALLAAALSGCSGGAADVGGSPTAAKGTSTSSTALPTGTETGTATGTSGSGAASAGASSPSGAKPATSSSNASVGPGATAAPQVRAVPGYVYAAPLPTVYQGVQTFVAKSGGLFGPPAVKAVTKGKSLPVGSVVVLALAPQYVGDDPAVQHLVAGLVTGLSGAGYTQSSQTVAGTKVTVATGKDSSIVAWYRAGQVVLVLSTEKPAVPLAFAAGYLAAG